MTKQEIIVECRDRFLAGCPLTLAGVLRLLNKLDDPADREPCEYCCDKYIHNLSWSTMEVSYSYDMATKKWNYCPNCGRKIKEEKRKCVK